MNILIVGGTGILSTAVVHSCISHGHSVTMVNRGNKTEIIHPKAIFVKCDVRNEDQLKEVQTTLAKENFDVVVDFLVFTESELKLSLKYFSPLAKQYVFISSAQVYNTSIPGILTEDAPKPQKLWSYSINKLACEEYLENYCLTHQIAYTIIRPAVNYGGTRIPYGIFPPMGYHWTLVERIKHGKPIVTWNNGHNKLNLTRVEDFAEAMIGLLGNPKAYHEAFNVAGDRIYTWIDVLNVLGELVGKKPITIDLPVQFYAKELPNYQQGELIGGRANDMVCSIEKLKKIVPWFEPKYDLQEGIRMTLDYYMSHGYLGGIDYSFDGNQDRIIRKFCKQKHINCSWKLTFVDYFSKGNDADRKAYYRSFNKDKIHIRIIKLFKSSVRKLIGPRLSQAIGDTIHR